MKRLVFFSTLFFALPVLASDASIFGKVSDSAGAVFVNLAVVIKSVSTHEKIVTRTVRTGEFGPVPLPAGVYKIEVSPNCFRPYSRTITLSESEPVRLDISLKETCSQPKIVE